MIEVIQVHNFILSQTCLKNPYSTKVAYHIIKGIMTALTQMQHSTDSTKMLFLTNRVCFFLYFFKLNLVEKQ